MRKALRYRNRFSIAVLFITVSLLTLSFIMPDSLIATMLLNKSRSIRHVQAQMLQISDYNGLSAPTEADRMTSKYPGSAIVTLAGGDTSARHLIALLQSLRDVKTELPVIVLLARGGLGSQACKNQTWKTLMNRSSVSCGDYGTIGMYVSLLILFRYSTAASSVSCSSFSSRGNYFACLP